MANTEVPQKLKGYLWSVVGRFSQDHLFHKIRYNFGMKLNSDTMISQLLYPAPFVVDLVPVALEEEGAFFWSKIKFVS